MQSEAVIKRELENLGISGLTAEDYAKAASIISQMGLSIDDVVGALNRTSISAAQATEAGHILSESLCEYRRARLIWYSNNYGLLRVFSIGYWRTLLGV